MLYRAREKGVVGLGYVGLPLAVAFFYLAFAPERIGASNRRYTIHNIPKIVCGITSGCTRRAAELYGTEIEEGHSVSSAKSHHAWLGGEGV